MFFCIYMYLCSCTVLIISLHVHIDCESMSSSSLAVNEKHFRLVKPVNVRKRELLIKIPHSSKWCKLVSRQSFCNFFWYNQLQLSTNVPKHCCQMILHDFKGFPKVLIENTIVTCLQGSYRANKMHICKLMFILCFHTTGTQGDVCFIYICFTHRQDQLYIALLTKIYVNLYTYSHDHVHCTLYHRKFSITFCCCQLNK